MHQGCFVWTPTPPLAGRRTPPPGPARVCVCLLFLAGSGGPASRARSGAAHLSLWPLWLSSVPLRSLWFFFHCPRPRCLSLSLVSGPGCLGPWRCGLRFFFLPPLGSPCVLAFFFLLRCWLLLGAWCPPPLRLCLAGFVAAAQCPPPFFFRVCAPVVLGFLWFLAQGALGLGAVFCLLCGPPASPLSVRSLLFLCLAWPLVAPWWLLPPPPPCHLVLRSFFFLRCVPPFSPAFSGFRPRVPRASAPRVVCFIGLPVLGSPCVLASSVPPVWPLAAPGWLPPPPPLRVSRFSSLPLGAVCRVLCCAVCPGLLCCAALLRVVSPGVVLLCAVLFCCARLVPLLVVPCPLVLPVALGPCALRRSVLRCSPGLCVFCRCVVVCAVVRHSALCCVCPWVPCCAFPVLSALSGAVLRCAGALALCCSCGACCCWRPVLWCAAVCCAVSFGVLWCGAGSGGPWLSAGAVLWRPAVRFPLLVVLVRIVYSDLVGYQTSDIRLLWTIITRP